MTRLRQLVHSPLAWGILTFVPVFVLASVLANQMWKSSRSQNLVRVLNAELSLVQKDLKAGRLPPLMPIRHGSEAAQHLLLQMFLSGAPISTIEGELSRFIEIHSGPRSAEIRVWAGWRQTLVDIRLSVPVADADLAGTGGMLHEARWHVANAQGWLALGDGERGLVHFLRALSLSRQVLQQRKTDQHDFEASFIVGKVLHFLFGRSGLLREVRSLGSSTIWSVRADRILMQDGPV